MKRTRKRKHPSPARPSPLLSMEQASLFLALTLVHHLAASPSSLRPLAPGRRACRCPPHVDRLIVPPPARPSAAMRARPRATSSPRSHGKRTPTLMSAYSLSPRARPAARWLVPPAFPRLSFFPLPLSSRIPAHRPPCPAPATRLHCESTFPSPVLLLLR
jgi:hypothetical protein